MFQGLSVSRKCLQQGLWAALKLLTKVFLASSYAKYLSKEEKADIWIKNCWALSVFETEDLAANRANQSVAYLFGWISRANKSLIQEEYRFPREELGWKNIFSLKALLQVLFPFDNYSQAASFLQLHARLTCTWVSEICTWRAISWWNIRAVNFTIDLRLVCSCLDILSSTSHQELILFHLQDFIQVDLIQNI